MSDHLSFSQGNRYERCGIQWENIYAKGERRPPGVALLVGSSTHTAVEGDLRAKLTTGSLLDADAVTTLAVESLQKRWRDEPPIQDDDSLDQNEAETQAAGLALAHHNTIAPTIEPTHVEREIVFASADIGMDVHCRLDVQTVSTIHDTKTASKTPSASDLRSAQFGLYRAALIATDGHSPDRIQIDALVKNKTPKAVSLTGELTDADAASAIDRLARVAKGIAAGIFLPADPTSWVCSAKFCGWYQTCPHGARNAVSVALVDPSRLTKKIAGRNLKWDDE